MRLFFLTALTMIAFAANSLLNRGAVDLFGMAPLTFSGLRVLFGVITLVLLVRLRSGGMTMDLGSTARWAGGLSLTVYMVGFSMSYQTLDAGLGALVLFGIVQLTMFSWAVMKGPAPSKRRVIGAVIAFVGLIILLAPAGGQPPDFTGLLYMCAAGFGWGVYSLLGQRETDPLNASAANFVISLPLVGVPLLLATPVLVPQAVLLAALSGAITSGLGYALWYHILPQLGATRAAMAQLTVPLIAVAGGTLAFSEPLSLQLFLSAGLVLGGLAIGIERKRAAKG
ncbi:DMT family transporter [Aestuariibius sp. HNIBRBA575]|uniref:DMT family transporter n=1 Tax=Aestuariibius sp. HNIBRBA575 TaxID=3233343 RepID=UPI0034A1EBA3